MRRRRRARSPEILDRARGVLLGLAVGDALGAAVEWLHPDQITARYGGQLRDMVASATWGRGEWTDDTAMALALASSLAECGGYAEDDVLARYRLWARSDPKDIGNTVRAAVAGARDPAAARAAARAFHEHSGGRSAGNGSVMRTAPIALFFLDDDAEIARVARLESSLTHHDPRAGAACVHLDRTLAALVRGREPPPPVDEAGWAAAEARGRAPANLAEEVHARLGFALTALRVGFAAALGCASFEEAVVAAVNLGGDADTNGAVTGALAGARFGASAIPERWLEPLRARETLAGLAGRLVAVRR